MAGPTAMTFRPGKGVYPPIPVDVTAGFDAFDDVNGMTFHPTGKEILVLFNPTVGAITYTIPSVPDEFGRSDTSINAHSIPAGGISLTGPWSSAAWAAAGVIGVTCSATGLLYLLTAASN